MSTQSVQALGLQTLPQECIAHCTLAHGVQIRVTRWQQDTYQVGYFMPNTQSMEWCRYISGYSSAIQEFLKLVKDKAVL